MEPVNKQPGVITTFYSYKGGTGRSMVLANVACLAARRLAPDERVLMIDWDLEAPGLHRYFPESEQGVNAERPGLIDYFTSLNERLDAETHRRLSGSDGPDVLESVLSIAEYIAPEISEGVDLIKAGRFSRDYANLVASFDWARFYRSYDRVYPALCGLLASRYRWIFIDSRTGLSDISGVCTMLMPEKLVTVFTPNRQSLEGVIELSARAVEYRRNSDDPRPLSVFPLPGRIITDEHELLKTARERYRLRFEECLRASYGLEECSLETYFGEVAIPHKGFYGFHEMVAVRDDPKATDALSINRAYESFFERLVNLDCAWHEMPATTPAEMPREPKPTAAAGPAFSAAAGFEFDIFVSYSHIDDMTLGAEVDGFVSRMVRDLSVLVTQRLGRRVRIWRDQNLHFSDRFDQDIIKALQHSAILLAVISPAYIDSPFLARELQTFVDGTANRGGWALGNPSRIMPVYITPVDRALVPTPLSSMLGFNLFQIDDSGRDKAPKSEQYQGHMQALASETSRMLKAIAEGQFIASEPGRTVFLAETASDLTAQREQLRQELLARGHRVVPEEALSLAGREMAASVRSCLAKAELSVHLIGERSGFIPEDETRSISELQYDLAAKADIPRIVWSAQEDSQLAERILRRSDDGDAEFVRSGFETLRSVVLDALRTKRLPRQSMGILPNVFLECVSEDLESARELRKWIFERGIEVTLPLFEGNPDQVRKDRAETLRACDGAIIFWASGSEVWLRAFIRDVRSARAHGRKRALPYAFYIPDSRTDAQRDFYTREGLVIRGNSPEELVPFFEQIRQGAEA